jgi:hypothetical protein
MTVFAKQEACMESHSPHPEDGGQSNTGRWAFWGFSLVAIYFLLTEHRAHLMSFLPYLLLAACPLMHFFHHGGHRRHHSGPEPDTSASSHSEHH